MESAFAIHEAARPRGWTETSDAGKAPLPTRIALSLREGNLPPDRDFDRFLPRRLRQAAPRYWTPLPVVAHAAGWLDELRVRTVVDIGSGTGKFCIAGALLSACHYIGIEQRQELVETARIIARLYGVENRTSFLHESFGEIAPPIADVYYFFNPFGENLFNRRGWLDDSVELGDERFARDLHAARRWLAVAAPGTYVLTYNGMGGKLPASYRLLRVERELPCVLQLWQQGAPR